MKYIPACAYTPELDKEIAGDHYIETIRTDRGSVMVVEDNYPNLDEFVLFPTFPDWHNPVKDNTKLTDYTT